MTTTTTDDILPRLTALETAQRETNARLTTVEGGVQDMQAEQRQTNARLDAVEGAVQDVQAEVRCGRPMRGLTP